MSKVGDSDKPVDDNTIDSDIVKQRDALLFKLKNLNPNILKSNTNDEPVSHWDNWNNSTSWGNDWGSGWHNDWHSWSNNDHGGGSGGPSI